MKKESAISMVGRGALLVVFGVLCNKWGDFALGTLHAAGAPPASAIDDSPVFLNAPLVSDDFNSCTLDPRWVFVNPLGDSTMSMNSTQVSLTVPAGTSHNVYDNGIPAPHLVQSVDNVDFEAVVKFESTPSQRYQVQGMLVIQDEEPDAEDFIRFDFFHDGTNLRGYAAVVRNGVPLPQISIMLTQTSTELYLKVRREGTIWTESFAFDGVNYIDRNFGLTTPMTVTQVGVFAANHGISNIPAYTAVVDYFFNTAAPISNEDGKKTTLTLVATPPNGGTVAVTAPPGQTNYACGEQITVKATPANGWVFEQWSGAIVGVSNPITFSYNIGDGVTGAFVESQSTLYLPLVGGAQ